MGDLGNVGVLFSAFATILLVYGFALARTGSVGLMPYRVRHTIAGTDDVRRVGRIVMVVAAVIGALAIVCVLIFRQ